MTNPSTPRPAFPGTSTTAVMILSASVVAATLASLDTSARGLSHWASVTVALLVFSLAYWRLGRESTVVEPVVSPAPTALDLTPILDRLDRIATALERSPGIATAPGADLSTVAMAVAESRWADAEALLADQRDHPDAPAMAARLAEGREAAAVRINAELKAAQEVNDPGRVVELRDALVPLLTSEALRDVDAGVVKWLMAAIMRRLRTGTVKADVAELATTVADRFGSTTEGASLRASLPTLRRSAGLCPRCARPYRGIAEACPVCMKAAAPVASFDPANPPDPVGEEIEGLNLADELPGELDEEPA